MRIYLKDSRSTVTALARGLATGYTVWCLETGEGWQLGMPSARHARVIARAILRYGDHEGHAFFYDPNEKDEEA